MTDTTAVYAQPQTYEALVEALKDRAGELGISYADIDLIAGLTSGYAGKCLGPSMVKRLGALTLFLILPALGLRVALVRDDKAAQRSIARVVRRHDNQARVGNNAAPVSDRVVERALRRMAVEFSWRRPAPAPMTPRWCQRWSQSAMAAASASDAPSHVVKKIDIPPSRLRIDRWCDFASTGYLPHRAHQNRILSHGRPSAEHRVLRGAKIFDRQPRFSGQW